jgi:hypothetical protein
MFLNNNMTALGNLQKGLMLSASATYIILGLQDLGQKNRRQMPLILSKSLLQLVIGLYLLWFYLTVMHGQ